MNVIANTKVSIELTDQGLITIVNAMKALETAGIAYTLKEEKVKVAASGFFNKKELGSKGYEILDCLSKGDKYNDIAVKVGISIDGVRYYVKKVFKALNVTNGREAVHVYLTEIKPYFETGQLAS